MNDKNMTIEGLFDAVRSWRRERKIDNPYTQTVKVGEEFGEVCHEVSRGDFSSRKLIDDLGDLCVTAIVLADIFGFKLEDCVAAAYDEIKDRKGKNINGGFVKDE